jgi:DNA-3-methyladenine glycosylase
MYFEGGHAYVYFTYGMHYCMNVVTAEADVAEAVLLRAAQPLHGIDRIRRNRPKAKNEFDLMSGPGKLCMALEINKSLNGVSLLDEMMFITARDIEVNDDDIAVGPRVGVDYAEEATHWPLRFYLKGNRHVSGKRA